MQYDVESAIKEFQDDDAWDNKDQPVSMEARVDHRKVERQKKKDVKKRSWCP